MLDTIGNNLANVDTNGFKTSTITFSDVLSETLNDAAAPTQYSGGVNPTQVGNGVSVGAIQRDFDQGTLVQTGNVMDVSIQGSGFFVVSNGLEDYYMRTGTLSVDSEGYLVDSVSGMWVQDVRGENIAIDYSEVIPGQKTSTIQITGNLDASASGPVQQVVSTTSAFRAGGAAAVGATELNDLDSTTVDYADGAVITISGTGADGSALTPVTFTYGSANDGTTLADLLAKINEALSGEATAALDSSGNIIVTADEGGEADLSLSIVNTSGTGTTAWSNHSFYTSTEGAAGDSTTTSIEVYDTLGRAHLVTLTFTKTQSNLWDMVATMNAADGTITDARIGSIKFQADGSYQAVLGTDEDDAGISIMFAGLSDVQNVAVNFGTPGSFGGLTQFGGKTTATASEQDGYGMGSLDSISIQTDGNILGSFTNGQTEILGQIGVAVFDNPEGLSAAGSNLWKATNNSGAPRLVTAQSSNAGSIVSGSLESSNVDASNELINLIVAQRGYQLAARTISVSQSVMQEVFNIVR